MLNENKNIYNIVKKCDYFTIRDFVIKSFGKIVNEEKEKEEKKQLTKVFDENRSAIEETQKEVGLGETLKNTDRIIISNNESCDYDRAIILPTSFTKAKNKKQNRVSEMAYFSFRAR